MAYNVKLQTETYQPVVGVVTYYDTTGGTLGVEQIPVAGLSLNADLVDKATSIDFSAKGYYKYEAPAYSFPAGDSIITLQKEPFSAFLPIMAFVGGIVVAKLLRL